VRAGNGEAAWARLGISESSLWCTSGGEVGVYRGNELRRSSRGGWFGLGHGAMVGQWCDLKLGWWRGKVVKEVTGGAIYWAFVRGSPIRVGLYLQSGSGSIPFRFVLDLTMF
jgi:hypothetical protein